jgi:hypothetical protein
MIPLMRMIPPIMCHTVGCSPRKMTAVSTAEQWYQIQGHSGESRGDKVDDIVVK